MRRQRFRTVRWLSVLGILFSGCQGKEEFVHQTPPSFRNVTAESSPLVAPAVTPDVVGRTESAAPAAVEPTRATQVKFVPPFPDRDELFLPPQRGVASRPSSDDDDLIVLKGFVRVDEPMVVLAIDGVVSPIGEGQEKYGIRVISIEPPSVVLQRGRNRWTATLQ